MREVDWSSSARSAYLRLLRELMEVRPAAAVSAEAAVTAALDRLNRNPLLGRASLRWPGLREFSLREQHKLIVFTVGAERLWIAGFYDQRQDLSAVDPLLK